jgi:serine/threonine protein kinase
MKGKLYNEKVDVWSFGMILYELATNTIPYDYCKDNVSFLIREVCEKKKKPPLPKKSTTIDPILVKLMKKCWKWNSQKRPSFTQITRILRERVKKKL